jgi:hypothetical protein
VSEGSRRRRAPTKLAEIEDGNRTVVERSKNVKLGNGCRGSLHVCLPTWMGSSEADDSGLIRKAVATFRPGIRTRKCLRCRPIAEVESLVRHQNRNRMIGCAIPRLVEYAFSSCFGAGSWTNERLLNVRVSGHFDIKSMLESK